MSRQWQAQRKPFSNTTDPPKSIFKRRAFSSPVADTTDSIQANTVQRRGVDLTAIRLFPDSSTKIQTKLTVGAPGDKYEQEADTMASRVMSCHSAAVQREVAPEEQKEEEVQTKPLTDAITPLVQREEMPEESELQTKPLNNATIQREAMPEEDEIQMKPLNPSIQRDVLPEEEQVQTKPLAEITPLVQRETMPQEEEEIQTKPLGNATIQREAMPEEEEIQTKPLNASIQRYNLKEEEEVQTKPSLQRATNGSFQAGSNIESQLSSSKGGGSPLGDEVRSFMEPRFSHDFTKVRVHTGNEAVQMNRELGAQAFTHGSDIYFGAGKSPGNNELTAHELTHVVQQSGSELQRKCINCEAEEVLKPSAFKDVESHQQSGQISPVWQKKLAQLKTNASGLIQRLGQPLTGKSKVKPAYGEDKGKQRRFSVQQYIDMWEAEQGRKLTNEEKLTLKRGCIGITALDISGGGNPPLDRCYSTFDTAKAKLDKEKQTFELLKSIPLIGAFYKNHHPILFAKLFWSNQKPNPKNPEYWGGSKAEPKAFRPDKNGKVDMTEYKYLARPGSVNFDYGFWDEASQSFWHANHSEPGMQVYQSTKEKFAAGYRDFDRIVYCIAIAKNYDPQKAAKGS